MNNFRVDFMGLNGKNGVEYFENQLAVDLFTEFLRKNGATYRVRKEGLYARSQKKCKIKL